MGNIRQVEDAQEIVAAEDASTNTWIHPTFVDEAQYYYPKGSLLGLMLDIRIREATNGRKSLDDVMRALWTDFYRRGRGFTTAELLGIIRPWYGGVDDFYQRYVHGREALPYADVFAHAGIAVTVRESKSPRIGVGFGDVSTSDPQNFGAQYRVRYGAAEGMAIVLSWVRGGQPMTGRGTVRLVTEHSYEVARDPAATPQARAILDGILSGQR
jgi:hypothetical protein